MTGHIWELVTDADYFRGVMGNMVTSGLGPKQEVTVRFGLEGKGVSPNYQLQSADGRIRRFHGLGHAEFRDDHDQSFDHHRISAETFAYEDIKQMLADRLARSK